MDISSQILDQIVELTGKHKVITIGEIHGVKENPEVIQEVYNALKDKFQVVLGLEYPQSLVDDPKSADNILYEDGRYSQFHQNLLEKLKGEGIEIFGFDLDKDQTEEQKTKPIDWRDKIMAENINKKLGTIPSESKLLIVTGDMHYQTKGQTIMYPDSSGEVKPTKYLPMGAQINSDSILAIHLKYLSGQFYNFKLRQMPTLEVDRDKSFRKEDDVVEIEIPTAHPTN